ncbi:MAG: hypothetical protein N3E51_01305 [Candidatus Micrarchaeota archaeon]|nr:hypothetical protein [Candidatus Micrarchaeota archaeon]
MQLQAKLNAQTALALCSAALSASGMLLLAVSYLFVFLSIGNLSAAVMPRLDEAEALLGFAAETTGSLSGSLGGIRQAEDSAADSLENYASSTSELAASLSSIASIPPFSLDSRLSSAASRLKSASASFSNASAALRLAANSASASQSSLSQAQQSLYDAKNSLSVAKAAFQQMFWSLHIGSLAAFVALEAICGSVFLLSASSLHSAGFSFFGKAGGGKEGGKGGQLKS